jgi:hypothetical protein
LKSSGPLLNEIKVTFRFVGDSVNPIVITSQIGLQPSAAHAKGEVVEKHPDRIYPSGFWGLESSVPTNRPLEDHLIHLLDVLEPRASAIKELEQTGLVPDFFCGVFIGADLEALLRLGTETLGRMVEIGASLELHLYCCEEEKDEAPIQT